MATLTFTDKQIRKMEKKARHYDEKFRKTHDKQYLCKADELRKIKPAADVEVVLVYEMNSFFRVPLVAHHEPAELL